MHFGPQTPRFLGAQNVDQILPEQHQIGFLFKVTGKDFLAKIKGLEQLVINKCLELEAFMARGK